MILNSIKNEKPANDSRQIQEQIQINRNNSKLINQRETEIDHILKSINELSTLFNDLATMVSDQVFVCFTEKNPI